MDGRPARHSLNRRTNWAALPEVVHHVPVPIAARRDAGQLKSAVEHFLRCRHISTPLDGSAPRPMVFERTFSTGVAMSSAEDHIGSALGSCRTNAVLPAVGSRWRLTTSSQATGGARSGRGRLACLGRPGTTMARSPPLSCTTCVPFDSCQSAFHPHSARQPRSVRSTGAPPRDFPARRVHLSVRRPLHASMLGSPRPANSTLRIVGGRPQSNPE